ncbi:MAG: hypothetical protein AMXMBFR64_30250 [Myxococcales bacterium]
MNKKMLGAVLGMLALAPVSAASAAEPTKDEMSGKDMPAVKKPKGSKTTSPGGEKACAGMDSGGKKAAAKRSAAPTERVVAATRPSRTCSSAVTLGATQLHDARPIFPSGRAWPQRRVHTWRHYVPGRSRRAALRGDACSGRLATEDHGSPT